MAENTTTYKAVIETEVKGADEMEDLGDKAEGAGEKFTKLQLQIRQTQKELQAAAAAGDKVKFEQLKSQLDDLEDGLEKVQFQSKQFEDQLAALPGPAGQAGNAIKGVDGAFKLLAANPVVAVIGAAVGIFLALKKSLESTAEGQATLNRVSQAFASVLGPILATLEKVAVPLFNGLAFVIEKVGKAFAFFAEKLGISKEKIAEATLSVDKVQQEFNKKETERLEDLTKKNEEALKKREEARKKAAEERKKREEKEAEEAKKRAEEEAKNLAEANKVLTEAYVATLDKRDQEIFQAGQKQNERLAALQKAGIKDVSSVIEQGKIEVAAINKRYDDEEAKKKEEQAKKDKDLEDKRVEDAKKAAEEIKAAKLAEIDFKNELTNLEIDAVEKLGGIISSLAGKNKKIATAGVIIQAAASIARIIANTGAANARAVLELGPIAGSAFAIKNSISAGLSVVATTIAAAKAIQQINASEGGGSAGSVGGSAPKVPAPTPPTVQASRVPQIQTGGGQNPTEQIAQTIGAAQSKPTRAYVVSQDISSTQAFDRRTNNAATF